MNAILPARSTRLAVLVSLTAIAPTSICLAGPVQLFAHDANANLFAVNVADGSASLIGNSEIVFTDIAFDADGRLFGISDRDETSTTAMALYGIDTHSAGATYIGDVGTGNFLNALVFDDRGTLWAAGVSGSIVTIDPTTGHGTARHSLGQYNSAGDLAQDAAGNLYLTTVEGLLIQIDRGDSSVTRIGRIPQNDVYGFARGPDGTMYGLTAGNQLLTIDTTTGASTFVADITAPFNLGATNGTSFTDEAVLPEPATIVLLAFGGFIILRRRRHCNAPERVQPRTTAL